MPDFRADPPWQHWPPDSQQGPLPLSAFAAGFIPEGWLADLGAGVSALAWSRSCPAQPLEAKSVTTEAWFCATFTASGVFPVTVTFNPLSVGSTVWVMLS